jgi:ribosomal protein S19
MTRLLANVAKDELNEKQTERLTEIVCEQMLIVRGMIGKKIEIHNVNLQVDGTQTEL